MATVPVSGTNIRILSGVPFSNDYKHSRWFDNQTAQTSYFLTKPVKYQSTEHTFQRIEGRPYIKVNKSIDDLMGANYLMFQNKQYNTKWFYAFVTQLEYVNKNVTYVYFQLDVLQTWRFEMDFKPSFVVREHCKLWNSDGTPVINTVDEGLHYGSEYDVVSFKQYVPYPNLYFMVIVSKSLMHGNDANKIAPTLNGIPQPLSTYIHPFRLDGSTPNVTINGEFGLTPILETLKGLYTQENAVNNIVSIYITDYMGFPIEYENDMLTLNSNDFQGVVISDDNAPNVQTIYVKDMATYGEQKKTIDANKYNGYTAVQESKLLMHPYTVLLLDDMKGSRHEYKNEYINGKTITLTVRGSLGTSNRVTYTIQDYNTGKLEDASDRYYFSQEHALINFNPNDIPVVTDYLAAYLQGNRNSIENQKNSIFFNGIMNAVSGGMSGGTAISQTDLNGGPAPNLPGAGQSALGVVQGLGNTVLQLQGIQAKQNDISNIPPSLTKMGNNTNYDYGNGYQGVYIIKKEIKPEYRKKLTDFFKAFGYKVNEIKKPNLHTRQHFNYIQTADCNITGNIHHEDLQELKSVFNRGITLWHTDDVGNYALENEVIS